MEVGLYRLYSVLDLHNIKIAVYSYYGVYPDSEIITDVQSVVYGNRESNELMNTKIWLYGKGLTKERRQFGDYVQIINKSRKIIEKNNNVDKAIFVPSAVTSTWRGEQILYHNKFFDEIKTDYPTFSGCTPFSNIII